MLRAPTAIGLDIGGRTAQLVAVSGDKNPQLVAALMLEFDPNKAYSRDEMIEAIRTLFHSARVTGPTVLAIPGNIATVQLLSFPKVSDAQLRRMVEMEVSRLAGLSPEGMVHDYVTLPTDKTPDQKALVGLCRASALNEQLALVSEAGVEADDITISTVALFNAFAFATKLKEGEVIALVEIGRDATNLAIEVDGSLQFVRSFPTGGNSFTSAVAESEQLDFTEAERWKTEQGEIPDTDHLLGRGAPRHAALLHTAENWVKELNTTLTYFFSSRGIGVEEIHRIVLAGGGAQLRGLTAFIEKRMGKPAVIGQPLQAFKAAPRHSALPTGIVAGELTDPRFAIAMGLALQGLRQATEPLSLLPPEIRAARIEPEEGQRLVRASLLAASIALTSTLWAATDYYLQHQRRQERNESVKRAIAIAGQIEETKNRRQIAEAMLSPFLQTAIRGPIYVETLRSLAETKQETESIWLLADAESYYSRTESTVSSTRVPRIPDNLFGGPRAMPRGTPTALQQVVAQLPPPLTTLVVEGFTTAPNLSGVKTTCAKLEERKLYQGKLFRRVDTLPIDKRLADQKRDADSAKYAKLHAQQYGYELMPFSLELILMETGFEPGKERPANLPTAASGQPVPSFAEQSKETKQFLIEAE